MKQPNMFEEAMLSEEIENTLHNVKHLTVKDLITVLLNFDMDEVVWVSIDDKEKVRDVVSVENWHLHPIIHFEQEKRCENIDIPKDKTVMVDFIQIPEGATNGDMIKAMFPKIRSSKKWICGTRDWWNLPYKGGQDGHSDQNT